MRAFVLLVLPAPCYTSKHQVNPLQIFSSLRHTEKKFQAKKGQSEPTENEAFLAQ